MKTILIVGSNGLVGTHFINLFNKKYKIVCAQRDIETNVVFDLENIDVLVFLAQSKEYLSREFTEDLMDTNVSLLRKYLYGLSGKCPKVILFSTGSVYRENDKEISEMSPLVDDFVTPYAASKMMSELLAKSFTHCYQNISIVRPFTIYGSGLKPTMLFNRIFNNIKNGNPVEIGRHGGIIFNPIHADDVANFIDYLIQRDSGGLEFFNIFGPEIVTLEQVIIQIGKNLNVSPSFSIRDWPLKKMIACSVKHAFEPKISLEVGVSKMIAGEINNVER